MTPRTPETSMIWDSIYLTAEQMKLLDTAAGRFGVSEKELMRSAGEAIYREVIAAVPDGDIAVVCDETVTVGALEESIRRGAKGLLKEVSLFDIYRGPGIADGKKSVAFNLVLRADDRSLTGEEADEDVQSILASLESECGAVLR